MLLCMTCGATAPPDAWDEAEGCPSCGDAEHPAADLGDLATITISTHELRILTFWADNFANAQGGHCPAAMTVIRSRLATQTDVALSMSQEIADLRAEFGEVTVTDADGKPLDL